MGKKSILMLTAAAMLSLSFEYAHAAASSPQLVLNEQSKGKVMKRNLSSAKQYAASPLKTTQLKAQGLMESVLIDEDFSAFKTGTVNKPDTTQMLACEYEGYSPNGIYVDNSLTKDGTWFGNFVYSAGGAVALKTYNPQSQAYICTPLGDYSGDITITLRVKANPAIISTDDGYSILSGSGLGIQLCYGGYEGLENAKTDDEYGSYNVRLYEKDGWQEVTYTCKNYSANNDGYICFYTEGSIVIDDVKVKAGSSFLASPVITGITDFQKDKFTIAWQPTRKSFNYYVDLYKREYLSENDTTFTTDFNDGKIGEGWESTSQTFSDSEGADDSKGLVLKNGDSFVAPTNGNDYKKLHFYLRAIDNTVDSSDEYAQYYVDGSLEIDLKTVDGWKNIGSYYARGFWKNSSVVELEKEYSKFLTGGFSQVRLRVEDMNEGAYFVLDDVDITAKPAYQYKIIGAEYSEDLNDNYAFTTSTKKTTCTFTGLDPETEYYYGVRAHNVSQFSERQYIHALGVAAPEVKDADDIDSRGSFTAHWDAAPKATSYTVDCYGVTEVDKDDADFPILEESFDGIDATVTNATTLSDAEPLNNKETTSLDNYAKLPGWTGKYNTVAQGMLGAEGDYDYTAGSITTPQLYLANADKIKITMKVYGMKDDELVVRVDGKSYYIAVPESGLIDGFFTVPVTADKESISFYSYSMAPFAIDYLKVGQDLKKGSKALTWLQNADTDAATTSYTFTGLDAYDFALYGYDVTSHYQYDEQTEVSSIKPSEIVFVNLLDGTSTTGVEEFTTGKENKVVARYTVDGRLVASPVKGLNILKLSDGRIVKIVVK